MWSSQLWQLKKHNNDCHFYFSRPLSLFPHLYISDGKAMVFYISDGKAMVFVYLW